MPSFRTGTVDAVLSERPGLQRVEVDGEPAYVLTQLIGPVSVGDRVVVNTTAVDLGLGTGGWHVVHWNLARDQWREPGPGHTMKLRYTSLQADVGAAEESGRYIEDGLGLIPVVVCALHSQVACVAAAFATAAPGRRLVYVMTDGAALPIALSDLVDRLRQSGLVAATVTAANAFGGDHEAVSLHSALAVARSVAGADAVVVGHGPGIAGTATRLGNTGVDVAAAVAAAAVLGGRPVVAVRASSADARDRHRGVSHHSHTALALAAASATVAVPRGGEIELPGRHTAIHVDVPPMATVLAEHGLEVTTMGRGPDDDPAFFEWAGAAGVAAASLLPARGRR